MLKLNQYIYIISFFIKNYTVKMYNINKSKMLKINVILHFSSSHSIR